MWFRSIADSENAAHARRRSKKRQTPRRRARPCRTALEQLEDRVLLSAVPPSALSEQSLAAVNALLKIESKFNDAQAVFLKAESAVLVHPGYDLKHNHKLSVSTADYLSKVDGDLQKIDADLIGSPTGQGAGGLDGVLLTNLALPTAAQKYLQNVLVPAVGQELELANKLAGLLDNQAPQPEAATLGGTPMDGDDLNFDGYELNSIPKLTVNFAQIENDLIAADPADLGPALGLQGSSNPGPAGKLLQDLAALDLDAAAPASPGESAGHGRTIAAVEAFLRIENQLIEQQDDLLKLESAFLKGQTEPADSWRSHIHPNFTSSPTAVDDFLKIDADLVQLDNDSIGPPVAAAMAAADSTTVAPGGIDGILLTLDLPTAMLAQIQHDIVPAVQSERAALVAMEGQLLQQQGQIQPEDKTSSAGDKKSGGDKPIEKISLNFGKVATALIQTDPQGLGPLVGGMLQDMLVSTADAEQVSLNFTKIPVTYSPQADSGSALNQTDSQELGPLAEGVLDGALGVSGGEASRFAHGSVGGKSLV